MAPPNQAANIALIKEWNFFFQGYRNNTGGKVLEECSWSQFIPWHYTWSPGHRDRNSPLASGDIVRTPPQNIFSFIFSNTGFCSITPSIGNYESFRIRMANSPNVPETQVGVLLNCYREFISKSAFIKIKKKKSSFK